MIRLGLRLTLKGGGEAAVRLAVTAVAMAIGSGMLLVTLAGLNGISSQANRNIWLATGSFGPAPQAGSLLANPGPTTPGLWWSFTTDQFGSETIDRVDVAASGPHPPVPPGIGYVPGPGQFYASPALAGLLRTTPADELGARFPGTEIGIIGSAGLPAPNSLVVIVGHSVRALVTGSSDAVEVRSIATTAAGNDVNGLPGGHNTAVLQVILGVGAAALLFPVLVFIGTATRLAATRREQRFAAMRLVGATPRQVSVISAVEAAVGAAAGVALGFGLFFALRPTLAAVPLTGTPFFPSELTLGLVDIGIVAIGVPMLAAIAARTALRRVQLSPLGVTRRVTPAPPRAYRLVPLLAGIGVLALLLAVGHPSSVGEDEDAYLGGFLLMTAGLVIAGPWLTMVGARIVAQRTTSVSALIAGRRLSDNPRGAFRTISGLILALFVTSVSVGVMNTMVADHEASRGVTFAGDTLVAQTSAPSSPTTNPQTAIVRLRIIPGVSGAAVIYGSPSARQNATGYVACNEARTTPILGHCARGASVASVPLLATDGGLAMASQSGSLLALVAMSLTQLRRQPIQEVIVSTNGSLATIERARTVLDIAFPYTYSVLSDGSISTPLSRTLTELQRLTDMVILASLLIAGCSLAVSVTNSVSERKRAFSLLRLSGVPIGVLRRVIAIEGAVPLVLIALVSIGSGLLGSELFLRSEYHVSLRNPGAAYYLIVVGGIGVALAVIGATLSLLERITGPENARSE